MLTVLGIGTAYAPMLQHVKPEQLFCCQADVYPVLPGLDKCPYKALYLLL
jgi:hypothetical protein